MFLHLVLIFLMVVLLIECLVIMYRVLTSLETNKMKFEIYSKDNCPNCEIAIQLVEQYGYEPIIHKNKPEELLERVDKPRSYPQIFVDGVHIGGLKQLQHFLRTSL